MRFGLSNGDIRLKIATKPNLAMTVIGSLCSLVKGL